MLNPLPSERQTGVDDWESIASVQGKVHDDVLNMVFSWNNVFF